METDGGLLSIFIGSAEHAHVNQIRLSFEPNPVDICLFNRAYEDGKQITVCFHVDDGLATYLFYLMTTEQDGATQAKLATFHHEEGTRFSFKIVTTEDKIRL